MLDGYDEIDTHCQDKMTQLVKSIVADKTRSISLYLTTRSHMAEDFQFAVGQLAYSLDDFSRQDQIDYLTLFLTANLKVGNDGKEVELVRNFAEKLVDRVTATLKDNEKSFIGIPLQCRIVAECFLSHLEDILSRTNVTIDYDGTSEKLLERTLDESKILTNLNLVSLYRLLMEKKKEIFRQEKVKAYKAESHCADRLVDRAMADLERDLIKLAITMVVLDDEDVNVLLGRWGISFQSDADREEEVSKRDEDGVRFGLLDEIKEAEDVTRMRGKVVFLHRTYAEYFVADHLYRGFHLDDKRHNKLLENESVRHFIIAEVLSRENRYNGVQIFFDSMLGELIDAKNEEWQNRMKQRNLPVRYRQLVNDIVSPQVACLKKANPLQYSIKRRKANVFLFLCDCLDATCDRWQVQRVMHSSIVRSRSFPSVFNYFCEPNEHGEPSLEMFRRFLSYSDKKDVPDHYPELDEESQQLIDGATPRKKDKLPCTPKQMVKLLFREGFVPLFERSYWNEKNQMKELVHCFLNYLQNNFAPFNDFVTDKLAINIRSTNGFSSLLSLFVWNENYHDSHLPTYLKLLSETHMCSQGDDLFAKLVEYSLFQSPFGKISRIDGRVGLGKMLAVLRHDLSRPNVAIKVSQCVLKKEPEAFRRYCRYYQESSKTTTSIVPINEQDVHDWLLQLLERDEMQMTSLHRGALYNQTEYVKVMLDNVAHHYMLLASKGNQTEDDDINKSLAKKVIDLVTRDDGDEEFYVTPLQLAIACNHEEICGLMLSFLKRVLDEDQLKTELTERNVGLLCLALRKAAKGNKNVPKVEWILKLVKRHLGQVFLVHLLRSFFYFYANYETYSFVVEIVVSTVDNNIKDYNDLNDLVLDGRRSGGLSILMEMDIETLHGMVSANGVGDWTRRLLDTDIKEGFVLILSSRFLDMLNADELKQLLDTITEKTDERKKSYWENFDGSPYLTLNFFRYVSTNQEINRELWIRRLVLSSDKKSCRNMHRFKTLVDAAFAAPLPQELLDEVKENAQNAIRDSPFFSSLSKNPEASDADCSTATSDDDKPPKVVLQMCPLLSELLHFYLDYGSDEQLSEFVDIITAECGLGMDKRRWTFWSLCWYHFKDCIQDMVVILQRLTTEKATICGRYAVQSLLAHEIQRTPLVLRMVLNGIDIHADILTHLPQENQEEIDDYFKQNVPKLIDDFFLDPETFFKYAYTNNDRLNVLRFFLLYANPSQQKDFIKNITTIECTVGSEKSPIWEATTTYRSFRNPVQMMEQFMECVKGRLGQDAVIQLALHVRNNQATIGSLMIEGKFPMVKAMVACLDDEKRQEVLHRVQKKLCDEQLLRVPYLK